MNYSSIIAYDHRLVRATALSLIAAILLWFTGLPMWIPKAGAGQLTNVSDLVSDSDLDAPANHTIQFTTAQGFMQSAGHYLDVTFAAGFDLSGVGVGDIDLASSTDYNIGPNCTGNQFSVVVAPPTITFTPCAGMVIASSTQLTIQIGNHATHQSVGAGRIVNPGTVDGAPASFKVILGGNMPDTGDTWVAIIDDVTVTAAVDSTFTFTITGMLPGQSVNLSPTTTSATSTATTLPFGTLAPGVSKVLAQDLAVTTNAANGFVVTVVQDHNLLSATGADIDQFQNSHAAGLAIPAPWVGPSGVITQENTYGHLGFTSEDSDLNLDEFGADLWAGNLGTPRTVFSHNGPADGTTADMGRTRVGYQVQIMALQEAGNDYTSTLTYVATPTF